MKPPACTLVTSFVVLWCGDSVEPSASLSLRYLLVWPDVVPSSRLAIRRHSITCCGVAFVRARKN